jgi:Flp pilus assembly protein TadG
MKLDYLPAEIISRPPRSSKKGSAMVEFTLVGIPLIFILISIFEISRGMWIYETVAYTVREGARFAAVHGSDCGTAQVNNVCSQTIGNIAKVISNQGAGIGLDSGALNVTIKTGLPFTNLATTPSYTSGATLMKNLLTNNTVFSNQAGTTPGNDVEVSATYPFQSALVMFWPGAKGIQRFGVVNFAASSRERIEF